MPIFSSTEFRTKSKMGRDLGYSLDHLHNSPFISLSLSLTCCDCESRDKHLHFVVLELVRWLSQFIVDSLQAYGGHPSNHALQSHSLPRQHNYHAQAIVLSVGQLKDVRIKICDGCVRERSTLEHHIDSTQFHAVLVEKGLLIGVRTIERDPPHSLEEDRWGQDQCGILQIICSHDVLDAPLCRLSDVLVDDLERALDVREIHGNLVSFVMIFDSPLVLGINGSVSVRVQYLRGLQFYRGCVETESGLIFIYLERWEENEGRILTTRRAETACRPRECNGSHRKYPRRAAVPGRCCHVIPRRWGRARTKWRMAIKWSCTWPTPIHRRFSARDWRVVVRIFSISSLDELKTHREQVQSKAFGSGDDLLVTLSI